MTIFVFSFYLLGISVLAGIVGALTGLGGGVVLIPALVLLLKVDIHYAMGASLISVIVTSSSAAVAYLRHGYTNLRIGMYLETGAVIGAYFGAVVVAWVSASFIAVLFSLVLFLSAFLTLKRKESHDTQQPSHPLALKLKLNSSYPAKDGIKSYSVQGVPSSLFIMAIAGCLSGLLGIGAGVLKVLAMDQVMHLPYKVSTATSNFIIGITAAVSVGVYFSLGYIQPGIIFPVMIGVTLGSYLGAKILIRARSQRLRLFFSLIICVLGIEMLYKALTGVI